MPKKGRQSQNERGLTITPNCGPLNTPQTPPPNDLLDQACARHDREYEETENPYFTYNRADKRLLETPLPDTIPAKIAKTVFSVKKILFPENANLNSASNQGNNGVESMDTTQDNQTRNVRSTYGAAGNTSQQNGSGHIPRENQPLAGQNTTMEIYTIDTQYLKIDHQVPASEEGKTVAGVWKDIYGDGAWYESTPTAIGYNLKPITYGNDATSGRLIAPNIPIATLQECWQYFSVEQHAMRILPMTAYGEAGTYGVQQQPTVFLGWAHDKTQVEETLNTEADLTRLPNFFSLRRFPNYQEIRLGDEDIWISGREKQQYQTDMTDQSSTAETTAMKIDEEMRAVKYKTSEILKWKPMTLWLGARVKNDTFPDKDFKTTAEELRFAVEIHKRIRFWEQTK